MAAPKHRGVVTILGFLLLTGCTVKDTEPPAVSGPSEFATAISIAANPDVLPQDGSSRSDIFIQARDPNAQPVRGLPLAAEIVLNGSVQDFGRLSARTVTTGNDGRASLTYTAPAAVDSVDRGTTIAIRVTPVGTDANGQTPRSVQIRLVPPGVIAPPGPPVPDFKIEPDDPTQMQSVEFNASDPNLDGRIVTYEWNFGDGSRGTGRLVQHQYRDAGVFSVTLTVTDTTGARGALTKAVTVLPGDAPEAEFVFSPSSPGIGTEVFFNGSASTAAPGRRIVSYRWEFGTGDSASGAVVSYRYDEPGSYNVTLVVTDDTGVRGTASETVTVSSSSTAGLTANFTFSPASPKVGTSVSFNASSSTSADRITKYSWDFGDGTGGSGPSPTTSHTFTVAGSYNVTLTVTDSRGRTALKTTAVNVVDP